MAIALIIGVAALLADGVIEASDTGNNVVKLYMWLQEHRQYSVPKTKSRADPHQALKSDVHDYWSDPQ